MRRPKNINHDTVEMEGLDKKLNISGTQISSRSSDISEDCSQDSRENEACRSRSSHKQPICVNPNSIKGGATSDTMLYGGYSYSYPGCYIGNYGKMILSKQGNAKRGSMLTVSTVKLHARKTKSGTV